MKTTAEEREHCAGMLARGYMTVLERLLDDANELARVRAGIKVLCEEGIERGFGPGCDRIPQESIYALLEENDE